MASGQMDTRRTGWFMIAGLATGHVAFHWIIQSFVVVLPEIQATFQLSAVGVGGILASRELASGVIRLPGGIARRTYLGVIGVCCWPRGLWYSPYYHWTAVISKIHIPN